MSKFGGLGALIQGHETEQAARISRPFEHVCLLFIWLFNAYSIYACLNGLWQLRLFANSLISSIVMVKVCSVMVVVDIG